MRTRRCAQHVVRLDAGRLGLRRVVERIVDELKISHDPINVDGADVFVRQPTQYASAGDCPVSMLTILEGRQFRVRVPPGPPISEGRTSSMYVGSTSDSEGFDRLSGISTHDDRSG
jgi:hypothetical protein